MMYGCLEVAFENLNDSPRGAWSPTVAVEPGFPRRMNGIERPDIAHGQHQMLAVVVSVRISRANL
jgi:hypothetical protein